MNQNFIVLGLVVIVIVGLIYFFTRNSTPVDQQPLINQETTITPQSTTQSGQVATESATVSIENSAFNPDVLTIKAGTTVIWTNTDSIVHTVNSDDFNSPNLNVGDTFEYTFDTSGTYDYTCRIHPDMKGQIIVE